MEIFRKKSIDNISNPEQLNDYIRVVTAPVWLFLLAVIILLAGLLVWGYFGEIEVIDAGGSVITMHPDVMTRL
ncbi:MAG: hypothetical protein K6E33_06625 [Lachnospiraceae bacterium]|nr:hypothetical protein [Lachnospiraceae bacterium]